MPEIINAKTYLATKKFTTMLSSRGKIVNELWFFAARTKNKRHTFSAHQVQHKTPSKRDNNREDLDIYKWKLTRVPKTSRVLKMVRVPKE